MIKMTNKKRKIAIAFIVVFSSAILMLLTIMAVVPKKDIINFIFKFERDARISMSGINIDVNKKSFLVISGKDPIIIVNKDTGFTLTLTKLDSDSTLTIYKNNFKVLGKQCTSAKYNVGGKITEAIEVTDKDPSGDKLEIRMLLKPNLSLAIELNKDNEEVKKAHIKQVLINNVSWVDK